MKKMMFLLAITACLSLISSFNSHAMKKKDSEREIDVKKLLVQEDGTVTIDRLKFKSMSEYFRSDHFRGTGKRCRDPRATLLKEELNRVKRGSASDCSTNCTTIKGQYWPSGAYTIPIVFHIIHKSDGTGNIPDSRIYNQVDVLNEDFGAIAGSMGANGFDMKIQFELVGITRTAIYWWFHDYSERSYKRRLGWDPRRYLNVYVNSASGYLGYTYFPQDMAGNTRDGVVLNYAACGGRGEGSAPYNQGRTLVHEIGHYLGLYHTFQDGCGNGYCAGDRIDDTNPESSAFYGCGSRSSCGSADPTTNYMNYSDDLCMWQFTAEQANRAVCCLVNYRSQLYY